MSSHVTGLYYTYGITALLQMRYRCYSDNPLGWACAADAPYKQIKKTCVIIAIVAFSLKRHLLLMELINGIAAIT